MQCERYRQALRDRALGLVGSREMEDHLAGCRECQSVLEDDQRLLAAIDKELSASAAVEPSPGLASRILLRVAEESSPRRGASRWTRLFTVSVRVPLVPALGLVLALIAGTVFLLRRPSSVPAPAPEVTHALRSPMSASNMLAPVISHANLEGFRPVKKMTIRPVVEEKP
jgi:hypothetical protein